MLIGELARRTNTKVETIRFYEREGLLPTPERTAGNYRSYGQSHLKRLSFVRRARDLGFTLDDVRELVGLAEDTNHSCSAVDQIAVAHVRQVDQKIADLRALRDELVHLIEQCARGTVAGCRILDSLAPKDI